MQVYAQICAQVTELATILIRLADPTPAEDDVTAGGTALVIFLLLLAAVVFLGFSLTKHLRKAQAAQEAGVYDETPGESTERPDHQDQQPS